MNMNMWLLFYVFDIIFSCTLLNVIRYQRELAVIVDVVLSTCCTGSSCAGVAAKRQAEACPGGVRAASERDGARAEAAAECAARARAAAALSLAHRAADQHAQERLAGYEAGQGTRTHSCTCTHTPKYTSTYAHV